VYGCVGLATRARARRNVEGARSGASSTMTELASESLGSGKGHTDENFPVASFLIRPELRAPILTFYKFARAGDDIADHETASEETKLAQLAHMRAGLDGEGAPEAMALGRVQRQRGIYPVHAHELLDAFVRDVTVRRYVDWDGLIDYCRLSAMPVGRFVLDVHGEDRATWPANDALCAALQVINHLQDCKKDYLAMDRVYIPVPMLERAGLTVEALGADRAGPGLKAVIDQLALQTQDLLRQSAPFAHAIRDTRLAAEVAIIQRLAEDLTEGLLRRDPLNENVHHSKPRAAWLALGALARHAASRIAK
jgi:squalene synthase HpnC